MTEISNQFLCAVLIIVLAVVIPQYIQLPTGLELLFHDKIGQVLLLLLAAVIGSYNLLCGLLLVVLFISIMLKSSVLEGFDASLTPEEKEALRAGFDPSSELSTLVPPKTMNKETEAARIASMSSMTEMPTMPTMSGMPYMPTMPPTSEMESMPPMSSMPTMSSMTSMPTMEYMPPMSSMPTMSSMQSMPTMESMPPMSSMPTMPSMPSMPTMSGMSGMPGMPGMPGMQSTQTTTSSNLTNQLLQTQLEKTKLETELNKYKIADMERQLGQSPKRADSFSNLERFKESTRTEEPITSSRLNRTTRTLEPITSTRIMRPTKPTKPTRSSRSSRVSINSELSEDPTEEPFTNYSTPEKNYREYFTNNLEENNALPKSIHSQFDIPPLEIIKSKKPVGKPAEQEQLYHNYKDKTSRTPNFDQSIEDDSENNTDESSKNNNNKETSSKLEEPKIEGFYGNMNSRFSGPTPQVSSQSYASVPQHPSVPEFNVEEAESLFPNYNGGTSRTPNYIDKSGMVEGFVGGDVVKSFKTNNPYDIAGCRYDGDNERPLHDVIYGAPVASCGAYGNVNTLIGTVFYPLNN